MSDNTNKLKNKTPNINKITVQNKTNNLNIKSNKPKKIIMNKIVDDKDDDIENVKVNKPKKIIMNKNVDDKIGDVENVKVNKPKRVIVNKKNINNDKSSDSSSDNNGDDDDDGDDDDTTTDVPLITELSLNKKETYHYKAIDRYYKTLDMKNIQTFIGIVEKKLKVSLRLIDWFVTKYSPKYNIRLDCKDGNKIIENGFNVHISYKAQLLSFRKKYFDPFRRKKRLKFKYFFDKDKKVYLCTTIGQLNFFKWAFTNGIVDYVLNNSDILSKSMTAANKLEKLEKIKKKDSEVAISATTSDTETNVNNKVVVKKELKKNKKPGIFPKEIERSMSLKF